MHIQPNAGDRFKKKKKSNATAFAAYYRQLIQVGIFFKAECNWFSVTNTRQKIRFLKKFPLSL